MSAEYQCQNCKEKWEFFPEDYHYKKSSYPTKCPHCEMPIVQMIKDVYLDGGLSEVVWWLRKRIFHGKI